MVSSLKYKVLNEKEAVILPMYGKPFKVYDGGGDVNTMVEWMHTETKLTLVEYKAAKANEGEDTCRIISITA